MNLSEDTRPPRTPTPSGSPGRSPTLVSPEGITALDFGDPIVASVDVIFNGHTHQVYAWDAPVPGKTRPIIQTGEYGNNVGQVVLTVDDVTNEVTSYVSKNVPRTTETVAQLIAKYPATVGKVKDIVDRQRHHRGPRLRVAAGRTRGQRTA